MQHERRRPFVLTAQAQANRDTVSESVLIVVIKVKTGQKLDLEQQQNLRS